MSKRQFGVGGPIYDYSGSQSLSAPHSSISSIKVVNKSIDISSIAAATTLDTTVALDAGTISARGIVIGWQISANLTANSGIVGVRVSAADQLTVRAINPTAAAVDPAAVTLDVVLLEP